jgi:DNA-binding cell septation regulator SpoVG
MEWEITRCDFYHRKNKKLLGFANVEFNDAMVLKGFKLFDGAKGFFITFSSNEDGDGNYFDTGWFKNTENGDELQEMIKAAIIKAAKKSGKTNGQKTQKTGGAKKEKPKAKSKRRNLEDDL